MQGRTQQFPIFATAIVAVLLAFYAPWLLGLRDFFLKDTATFFEPLCRVIAEGLRQGRLPLWNPYSYCGMSEAAISSPSVFYPPNWLFAILPFSSALAVVLLFSQLVCCIGMYLLVASFGWGVLPAVIAASAVGLSGFMFSFSSNYTIPATAAWLPLLLYLTRQCLVPEPGNRQAGVGTSAKTGTHIATAAVIAMLISAGRPEISGPALLICLGLAALLIGQAPVRTEGRIAAFAKALFIGALLAMPTVLPSLEWIPLSRRSQGLPAAEILMYSSNWYDLLCMCVPLPLGDLQLRGSPFSPLVIPGSYIPYFGSAFVGSIALMLACLGLSKRGGAPYWGTVALLLCTIVLALGQNVPGMDNLIVHIPGASFIRFPSKLLFFAVFALALLAARGAKLYLHRQVSLIPAAVASGLAVVVFAAVFFQKQIVLPFIVVPDPALAIWAQKIIALRALLHVGIASIGVILLFVFGRKEKQTIALGVLVVLEVGLLVFNAFANCSSGAPPGFYSAPSFIVETLSKNAAVDRAGRITALYPERFTIPPSHQSADQLSDTVKDFQYGRAMLRPFCNADYGVPSAFGFEGAMVGEYYYYFLNLYVGSSQASADEGTRERTDIPLYRLLQCGSSTHVITQMVRLNYGKSGTLGSQVVPQLDSKLFERVWADPSLNAQIYKLKQPLPRAYITDQRHVFASRDDLIGYMANAEKTGFDPARETLIETSVEPPASSGLFVPAAIHEISPEQIEIDTSARQAALLVLQDQFYPGWIATVDGRRREILRCNGFMRGVELEAGSHNVRFSYEPGSVYGGLLLSLLGALWCILLLAQERQAALKGKSDAQS